jgi:hypothetical protein
VDERPVMQDLNDRAQIWANRPVTRPGQRRAEFGAVEADSLDRA